jgi:ribosome-associated translation inhibitor RaiA
MKLNLRFNRMSETEKDRQLVNQELATLAKELPIRGAEAVVEHPEQDVSIRMRVKLDLPGSPVVAEAKDYTLKAVLRKALTALKRKLSRRNQGRGATPYDRRRHSMPTAARA